MDSLPDTITFGSGAPSASPDELPDTVTFGGAPLEPGKWSGAAGVPAQPATWADMGHAAMAGVHGVAATGAGFAAGMSGDSTTEAGWAKTAQEQQQAASESEAAMTPTVQGGWSHPGVWAAEQAPGLAALAVPAVVAGALTGGVAATPVIAGLMGAQYSGDEYNRLKSQGVEPTFQQKAGAFSLGVATGLATELTGGVGKIATNPLVDRALGIGAESATFGASGAAQEESTEKAEIAGGTRKELDPAAIAREGIGQGEFGIGLGVLGGGKGHGRGDSSHGDKQIPLHKEQEDGGFTVTRSDRDGHKEGVSGNAGKGPTPMAAEGGVSDSTTGGYSIEKGPQTKETPDTTGAPSKPAPEGTAPPVPTKETVVDPAQEVAANPEGKAQEPQGAPPAAEAAAPEAPPPPEPAPPPAAQPEAPAPPPPAPVDPALQAQHAELTDPNHPREMMRYPPGVDPIETEGNRYGVTKSGDGKVQFDRQGDNKLSWQKVRSLDKAGTLDDLDGRPKAPEPAPAPAPEVPAPEAKAAEVKEEALAPADPLAGATKLSENKFGVSIHQAEDGSYLKQSKNGTVAPVSEEGVRTYFPEAFGGEPLGSRVLRPTEETTRVARDEAAIQQAQTVSENLKRIHAQETGEVAPKGEKHWTKEEQLKAKRINDTADNISAGHPAGNYNNREAVLKRAQDMVAAAKKSKIDIPDEFREGHPYNPSVLRLREAADLVKRPDDEALARYMVREHLIDTGRVQDALADRRSEGQVGLGSPEKAGETGRMDELEKEEDLKEAPEYELVHDAPAEYATREEGGGGGGGGEARERPKVVAEAKEGEHYEIRKPQLAAFKTEVRKDRRVRLQEMQEGAPGTVRDALYEHGDVSRYGTMRGVVGKLRDIVNRLTGDTPVHFISHAEMLERTGGKAAHGMYDVDAKRIYINKDNFRPDTLLHEAFHAATTEALEKSPELTDLMTRLHQEASDAGLTTAKNPEEFLTHLMTDPAVQARMKGFKVSDQLARDIGIPKWRKATMWNGMLHIIQKALGLGREDTSAIEAAMSISEKAMEEHAVHGEALRDEGAMRLMRGQAEAHGRMMFHAIEHPDPEKMEKAGGTLGDAIDKLAPNVVKTIAKDAKVNASHWWGKAQLKIMNGVQIAGLYRDKFKDGKGKEGESILDAVNHAVAGREVSHGKMNEADMSFLMRTAELARKYQPHMAAYGDLLGKSTRFDQRADAVPGKALKNPEKGAKGQWQANANHVQMHKDFNALPEEVRQHYSDYHDFLKSKATALGEEHITRTMKAFKLPKDMQERALSHSLTDADKEVLHDKGIGDEIGKAYRLMNPKATYFSAFRDGDHVVKGMYKMPDGGSGVGHDGEALPSHVREFDTLKAAHEYATGTQMKATPENAYYLEDPKNPGKYLKEVTDPSTGKTVKASADDFDTRKVQVGLQREHMEMHRTAASASRARDALLAHPDMDKSSVSQVLDKRKDAEWAKINGASALTFEHKIKDLGLTPAQEDHLIQTSRQLTLASQSGNRLGAHWNARRDVAGAEWKNVLESAHNYANAANYHISASRALPALDSAMQRLDAHAEANTTGPDATAISNISNSMRDRVYGGEGATGPGTPTWLRALRVAGFSKYLLTPRFIMQHQMHPLAYGAPQMAGRHGYLHSVNYLKNAYSDIGGAIPNVGRGLMASGKMAKAALGYGKDDDRLTPPVNYVDSLIGRLESKNSREGQDMREIQQTGHFGSAYNDDTLGTGKLDKVEAVMRQTTNAMEATNRVGLGTAAYRAEYDKLTKAGKPSADAREGAITYARQTIEKSMGVSSPGTIAPFLKHPVLRSAMQFRQFPMQLNYAIIRNAYEAFHGESPEVKREAVRALGSQLGSAAVMTGVHGMPIAALKAVGLLGYALGVTPSPSQMDDRMRRSLAGMTSPTVANGIMDGLPGTMPFAPDLSNMFGYNADFFHGDPHNGDWKSYMWDTLTGAPGSVIADTMGGIGDVAHGDWAKGMGKLTPVGVIANAFKANILATEGAETKGGLQIMPASLEAGALKMFGLTTQAQSRGYAGKEALQEDMQDVKDQKAAALDAARHGTVQEVMKWNNANPQDKISPAQMAQARHGQSTESILGVKVTKKDRADLEERGRVYQ